MRDFCHLLAGNALSSFLHVQALVSSPVKWKQSFYTCDRTAGKIKWDNVHAILDIEHGVRAEALEPGIGQYSKTDIINTIAINVPFQTACWSPSHSLPPPIFLSCHIVQKDCFQMSHVADVGHKWQIRCLQRLGRWYKAVVAWILDKLGLIV